MFVMKYENEINEMLNTAISKERWMTDAEYKELIDEVFKRMGITKQKLSDDIEIGVKNGYTVEQQISVMKLILNDS